MHSTGDLIVMSRLLVMQSKRILLASCANRLRSTGNEHLRARLAELESEAEKAHRNYRKAVLAWASSETAQYWLVAQQSMIEGAEDLVAQLRESAGELPQPDRGEVGGDIVRIEKIIGRWREGLLESIAAGGGGKLTNAPAAPLP